MYLVSSRHVRVTHLDRGPDSHATLQTPSSLCLPTSENGKVLFLIAHTVNLRDSHESALGLTFSN